MTGKLKYRRTAARQHGGSRLKTYTILSGPLILNLWLTPPKAVEAFRYTPFFSQPTMKLKAIGRRRWAWQRNFSTIATIISAHTHGQHIASYKEATAEWNTAQRPSSRAVVT